MKSNLPPCYATSFERAVRDAMIVGLERAYATAREAHLPGRGANEVTFGFTLYHYAVHELSAEAESLGERMEVVRRAPTFRLRVGDYVAACHRVGSSESDPIEASFPGNDSAAPAMVETQLWLNGIDDGLFEARNLVLAHMGNTTDGLCAAYLCIPRRIEKDRIVEWAHTDCIWRRGAGQMGTAGPAPSTPPPPEPVPSVIVIPRRQDATQHA